MHKVFIPLWGMLWEVTEKFVLQCKTYLSTSGVCYPREVTENYFCYNEQRIYPFWGLLLVGGNRKEFLSQCATYLSPSGYVVHGRLQKINLFTMQNILLPSGGMLSK